VNVTEWRILALLAIEPAISAARICHVIGFDKGPVSRTLAVMEQSGLVTIRTDESDGRTHAISLTSKGRTTHDQVIAAALERERRLLSCLRKDEREVLINLLGHPQQSRCGDRAARFLIARSSSGPERRRGHRLQWRSALFGPCCEPFFLPEDRGR